MLGPQWELHAVAYIDAAWHMVIARTEPGGAGVVLQCRGREAAWELKTAAGTTAPVPAGSELHSALLGFVAWAVAHPSALTEGAPPTVH